MKLRTIAPIRSAKFTFSAAFILASALLRQETGERLRLIHADVLKRETVHGRAIQKLQGNVEFQQGETNIRCDLATQIFEYEPAALIGNVRIVDDKRQLFADTVYFYQKENKQVALGNVLSITESDTTRAQRISYFEEENKFVSENAVRIANVKDRTIVTGGVAEFFRDQKYGKILLNPALAKLDSLRQVTMTISGDTMEVFESGKRVLVKGNVKIHQQEADAVCGRVEYFKDEKRALLTEKPAVVHSNQNISGDTLMLYFEDEVLSRAFVAGNALATSEADTLNKGRWVNKLSGETMNFYFENKKLLRAIIENRATSLYHVIENRQYKGVNEVSGDRIEVYLNEGAVQRVKVMSDPEFSKGLYSPPRS
jgi:lipopolysaccharide export system protein LptA